MEERTNHKLKGKKMYGCLQEEQSNMRATTWKRAKPRKKKN